MVLTLALYLFSFVSFFLPHRPVRLTVRWFDKQTVGLRGGLEHWGEGMYGRRSTPDSSLLQKTVFNFAPCKSMMMSWWLQARYIFWTEFRIHAADATCSEAHLRYLVSLHEPPLGETWYIFYARYKHSHVYLNVTASGMRTNVGRGLKVQCMKFRGI